MEQVTGIFIDGPQKGKVIESDLVIISILSFENEGNYKISDMGQHITRGDVKETIYRFIPLYKSFGAFVSENNPQTEEFVLGELFKAFERDTFERQSPIFKGH